jgi:flavodoxin
MNSQWVGIVKAIRNGVDNLEVRGPVEFGLFQVWETSPHFLSLTKLKLPMHMENSKCGTSAAVLFSTRFGTTEKIAKALESGLREAGMDTLCSSVEVTAPESLKKYDLICLGGPTEIFSASKPMKNFLDSTRRVDLESKFGFAFDTKYDSRMSGSAARYIEHALDDQGLHVIAHRESAMVTSQKEGGRIVGAVLKEGEEGRFERIGFHIGTAFTEANAKIRTR